MTRPAAVVSLFHNLQADGSFSMQRYGRELSKALRASDDRPLRVLDVSVERPRAHGDGPWAKRFNRLSSAGARYVYYPAVALAHRSGVCHILDHGYSQLVLTLPPQRTVVTCHDMIPLLVADGRLSMGLTKGISSRFRYRVELLARVAAVIAVSESTKRNVLEFTRVSADRIHVVPNGVSDAFALPPAGTTRETTRRALGLPRNVTLVLQISTKAGYKNTIGAMQAFALARQDSRSWFLLRVGPGLDPDESREARRLGIEPYIIVNNGVAKDQDLARFYWAADILLFPSDWEGFGWPPLEAMACGLPVVTSNAGSLPEVVGDAAIMKAPRDVAGLAEALGAIASNQDLRQDLVERGVRRASLYSWRRTAEMTRQVYDSIGGVLDGRTG